MGQYQQWLRYQEIDRSQRKTRQALEEELAELEGQLDTVFFEQLAQHLLSPLDTNPIISALSVTLEIPDPYSDTKSSPYAASSAGPAGQLASEIAAEDTVHAIFALLQAEEVEQFYAAYRQWHLQQRIVELRQRLAALQEEIGKNELRIQQYRPSPIALASLARLQSNGVSDIELLDQMLERGEAWLDTAMQHLDYVEQFENFLSDDYTEWCRRALDGAFDWMDSLLTAGGTPPALVNAAEAGDSALEPSPEEAEETEAKLLQKLSSEGETGDEPGGEEPTLKYIAVQSPVPEEAPPVAEATPPGQDEPGTVIAPGEGEPDNAQIAAVEQMPLETEHESEAEAIAPEEVSTSDAEAAPAEEPPANGTTAEIVTDLAPEEPTMEEPEASGHSERNGDANEEAASNGMSAGLTSPSLPDDTTRITAQKKRGGVRRLVGKLLGG
jgi:hypothetical protein